MNEMDQDDARLEALRGVVERLVSWQETAPEGTIRDELDKALREAGVTLSEEQKSLVVEQISQHESVDVQVLATHSAEGGPA